MNAVQILGLSFLGLVILYFASGGCYNFKVRYGVPVDNVMPEPVTLTPKPIKNPTDETFTIVLANSGESHVVEPGQEATFKTANAYPPDEIHPDYYLKFVYAGCKETRTKILYANGHSFNQ